jgi:hypothetical protein
VSGDQTAIGFANPLFGQWTVNVCRAEATHSLLSYFVMAPFRLYSGCVFYPKQDPNVSSLVRAMSGISDLIVIGHKSKSSRKLEPSWQLDTRHDERATA